MLNESFSADSVKIIRISASKWDEKLHDSGRKPGIRRESIREVESLFAHLILDVESIEASLSFYHGQLGLALLGVGELDGHRLATVKAGDMEILLLQQPLEDQPPVRDRGKGLVMTFRVTDLAHVAERLKQSSVEVLRDLEGPPLGNRTLLIADPDGYSVLLSEAGGTVH